MTIILNGKEYVVIEQQERWLVESQFGKVKVKYEISKKDCATKEELKEYLTSLSTK